MATEKLQTRSTTLPAGIQRLLRTARRAVRSYVLAEALCIVLAWCALAFWLSLGIDRLWEPGRAVRVAVLTAGIGTAVVLLVRSGLFRALRRISNATLALIVERYHAQFRDSLITTVELSGRAALGRVGQAMLSRTAESAEGLVPEVQLRRMLNLRRLLWLACGALVLFGGTVGFCLLMPQTFGIWADRYLAMSDRPWPRRVHLSIEGFPDGVAHVPRGDDHRVIVKADTRKEVPERVEIRYRDPGGRWLREAMIREGVADPAQDRYQEYSYVFRSLISPVTFDVYGGDARLHDLQIHLVDRPVVTRVELEYKYPTYLNRESQRRTIEGIMEVPEGTALVLHARCNKPISHATAGWETGGEDTARQTAEVEIGEDGSSFTLDLGRLEQSGRLLIGLVDRDSIASREPYPLVLSVVEDTPPRVDVRVRGVSSTVTAEVVIPLVGRISDDHGVGTVTCIAASPSGETRTPLVTPNTPISPVEVRGRFDAERLGLEPDDRFSLVVEAADTCDLAGDVNRTQTQPWNFQVVTPEELRSSLQAREMILRQRFESHIADVERLREQLVANRAMPQESGEEEDEDAVLARRLAVIRSRQDCRKAAHDVENVEAAFRDIYLELENNRVVTPEDGVHLLEEIADPLATVGERLYNLEERLAALESQLDAPQVDGSYQAAIDETTEILQAMRAVLEVMLKMEDFNEAVELLKSIIEMQKEVEAETRRRHAEELRRLLEGGP